MSPLRLRARTPGDAETYSRSRVFYRASTARPCSRCTWLDPSRVSSQLQ